MTKLRDDDAEPIRLLTATRTDAEISVLYDVTPGAITRFRKKQGIPAGRPKGFPLVRKDASEGTQGCRNKETAERKELLIALNGTKTLDEMASLAKMKRPAVYQFCRAHDIPFKRIERHILSRSVTGVAAIEDAQRKADMAETTTYVDEDGRTITRCPTRWAGGVGMGRYTAKANRGK